MTPERQSSHRRSIALAGLDATILAMVLASAVAAESPGAGSPAAAASVAPGGSGAPSASGGNAISIVQKTFQPSTLTVHVGDTVTWTVTQAISDPHSVTSGSYKDAHPGTEFDSGIKLKNNGDSFSHTFTAAGTFSFFCAVHPDTMSGTITVVAANGSTGGGGEAGGIPVESKLIAGGVLVVALILLFGWASLYRRMNPQR